MAQFHQKVMRFLCIALLSSMFDAQLYAKKPVTRAKNLDSTQGAKTQALPVHVGNSLLQQKQLEALAQIDAIESVFDTIGQSLATGSSNISTKRKAITRKKLSSLRSSDIDRIKRFAAVHVTPEQLYQLALFNQEVINILEQAVKTNLRVIPAFDFEGIQKKYQTGVQEFSLDKVSSVLRNNSLRLVRLERESQKIGLSRLNIAYRGVRKFNKDWSVGFVLEHAAVYTAFLYWWLYVTSVQSLREGLPFGEAIAAFKEAHVGSSPKGSQVTAERSANIIDAVEKNDPTDKNKITRFILEGKLQPGAPLHEQLWDINVNDGTKKDIGTKDVTDKYGLVIENKLKEIDLSSQAIAQKAAEKNASSLAQQAVNSLKMAETMTPDQFEALKADTYAKMYSQTFVKDYNQGYDAEYQKQYDSFFIEREPASGKISRETPSKSNDHSRATRLQNVFGAIIKIDNEAPIFSITTGALFAKYFENDAKLAADKLKILKAQWDDYFFGTAKKNNHQEAGVRHERFKDIVGREEVKAELARVIDYICNPDRFERAGIRVERGYLFAGTPQTGKTLMAKALAGEISAALERQGKSQKMRLFEISTENLSKKGIQYYMDLARTFSPCILFLDELDLMRLQRDGDSKALSEFLTQMSGSLNNNEKDQVIILAATNKPENLDFALRQHGRFGKVFWFGEPTFKHRVEFFIKECEKRCMNTDSFNFIALAQQTESCSFGSLDIVFKKALMHAKIENAPVTQAHFERAIDSEIRKLIPTGYSIPAEKEEVIAARQAGKALASILLSPAKTLCSVTVLPITIELEEEHVTQQYNFPEMKKKEQNAVRYGNIFAYHLYDALDIQPQDELVKQCKILLASSAAQRVYGLSSCAFDKIDKQEAFNLAKTIVLEGLDPKEMAKDIRNQKLTEAYRLIEKYEAEMEALLTTHKENLVKIIKGLQHHKTLSIGQINDLLDTPAPEVATV